MSRSEETRARIQEREERWRRIKADLDGLARDVRKGSEIDFWFVGDLELEGIGALVAKLVDEAVGVALLEEWTGDRAYLGFSITGEPELAAGICEATPRDELHRRTSFEDAVAELLDLWGGKRPDHPGDVARLESFAAKLEESARTIRRVLGEGDSRGPGGGELGR